MVAMATVMNQIGEWATDLPYWEQLSLEKLVTASRFDAEDCEEVLAYLLDDAGLATAPPRPTLTFPQLNRLPAPAFADSTRLSKISNLRNVNALVRDQQLTFGPKLTVVFGANGSGKSGYARVIGSAAFTRGDQQVLRNVTKPGDLDEPISATFELMVGDDTLPPIAYTVGDSHPALRSFYVFDSTSVRAHLTKFNPLSFAPAGLALLTDLVAATDSVRKLLKAKIGERSGVNPLSDAFAEPSAVTDAIAALGPDTDLDELKALATLSKADEARLEALDAELANLERQAVPRAIATIQTLQAGLRSIQDGLASASQQLGSTRVTAINAALEQWRERSDEAEAASTSQFDSPVFEQIGSPQWHELVEAAHHLASTERVGQDPYTTHATHCVLCHQALSDEASTLLSRLWALLESDAATAVASAAATLASLEGDVRAITLPAIHGDDDIWKAIRKRNGDAVAAVERFLSSCARRREEMLTALSERKQLTSEPLPSCPSAPLTAVMELLDAELQSLAEKNPVERIAALRAEKREIEHRKRLAEHFEDAARFVADCRWVRAADQPKVRGSSKHITTKYNKLFQQLVTGRYVERFEKTLAELSCPMKVEVKTRTSKGQARKQVVMLTDASVSDKEASPDKVLSEGEQRAVALADFLTEVAVDDGSSGVMLDDPVTSLDFAWKKTITNVIVGLAQKRQVIVFTHDLHFLHCLQTSAGAQSVPLDTHWIERRDNKPGWVFLNNSPVSDKTYKSSHIVKGILKQASGNEVPPATQQALLSQGFAALRTCYEAFVQFELFKAVVLRFEERLSIGRLKDVYIEPEVRDEVIDKVGLLSRYIEGHLHSDAFVAHKPTTDMLQQEIDDYEALKKRHKAYVKACSEAQATPA